MNIALIGYGYWGRKVYQTLLNFLPKSNIYIVDPILEKNASVLQIVSFEEILLNKNINHVLIITPEETHFEISKNCLENNKDIFVEKPLCLRKKDAEELHQIAKKNDLQIYVDYIFLYDPYIKKIKEIIKKGIIGDLIHIESIRHSVNINKPNITVLDDLATHDIYLSRYFFTKEIKKVETLKESILLNQTNQASAILHYGNQTLSAHYSWIQPNSSRIMTFIGTTGTLVWDKNEEDLLIYKNQTLIEKVTVERNQSPLEISLKKFLYKKNNYNYTKDVAILEKLNL